MPSTHDEVVKLAYHAYKEGTEAKESVQSYREKLSRIKDRLEEVRNDVETISEERRDKLGRLRTIENSANGAQILTQENNEAIEVLKESVGMRASAERVSGLQEELSAAQGRLSSVEASRRESRSSRLRRDVSTRGGDGWWSRRSTWRRSRWWRTPRCWWVRWRSRRI